MYHIKLGDSRRVYEGRFTNCGDACIAIVAAVNYWDGEPRNWAAYMGALSNKPTETLLELRTEYTAVLKSAHGLGETTPTEEETMLCAAVYGNKMTEADARYYFTGEPFDGTPWRD